MGSIVGVFGEELLGHVLGISSAAISFFLNTGQKDGVLFWKG